MQPTILAINGPTASGKSGLAVDIALRLKAAGRDAEVVNADSMLVYRGMDIGTAKPTLVERRGVRHHLVDIMDVTETATVADFQELARSAIAECKSRGVVPIVVGGSALYMRAILDEFTFPGTDAGVRAGWEARLAEIGPHELHEVLVRQAPDVAAGIQPGNGRRTVRALEVIELTGDYRSTLPEWTYALEGVISWGLELPREEMDARIDSRVEGMWDAGLVAEVRVLADAGLRSGRTASKALGYRQVLDYLDGRLTQDEAKAATKAGTRRFARKQLGWFRRDHRIRWADAAQTDLADEVLASLSR